MLGDERAFTPEGANVVGRPSSRWPLEALKLFQVSAPYDFRINVTMTACGQSAMSIMVNVGRWTPKSLRPA